MWFSVSAETGHLAVVSSLEPRTLKLFMVMNTAMKEENTSTLTDTIIHPYATAAGVRKWRAHLPSLVGAELVTSPHPGVYSVPSWTQMNSVRQGSAPAGLHRPRTARNIPWLPYSCHPDVLNTLDAVSAKAYKTFFLLLCSHHTTGVLSLTNEDIIPQMVLGGWRKWRQHLPELVGSGLAVIDGQQRISVPSYVEIVSTFRHRSTGKRNRRIPIRGR
jgi:hypothetical protein